MTRPLVWYIWPLWHGMLETGMEHFPWFSILATFWGVLKEFKDKSHEDDEPIYKINITFLTIQIVQFSQSVVSDSLQLNGLQRARPPCPSPSPGVYSNLCPLSLWCHQTISSSVVPFSSHLQSFPASESFKWVSSSHQEAKVLGFHLQHQSFQWIFRNYFL